MKMKRLENNEYALQLSFKKLKESIKNNAEQDIYVAIGELLLWVLIVDEWHMKHNNKGYISRRNNDQNGQILLGLRHSYNLMKHNMDFYKIHKQEGGIQFPISFPLSIEIKVVWLMVNEDIKGMYKNQEQNYKKYIQGKIILDTFDSAIYFLGKENKEIKKICKNK